MCKIIALSARFPAWLTIVFQEMNHFQEVSHLIGQIFSQNVYRALVNETSNFSISVFFL